MAKIGVVHQVLKGIEFHWLRKREELGIQQMVKGPENVDRVL